MGLRGLKGLGLKVSQSKGVGTRVPNQKDKSTQNEMGLGVKGGEPRGKENGTSNGIWLM